MHKVHLDRKFYHLIDDLCNFCKSEVGPGGWVFSEYDPLDPAYSWCVHSMFGCAVFKFKESSSVQKFISRLDSLK